MTVKAPGPMTNLSSLRLKGSRVCRSRQPPDMTIIVAKKEAVGLQQLLEGEYLDFMRMQMRSCDGGFA